jgi:hypothetical protein
MRAWLSESSGITGIFLRAVEKAGYWSSFCKLALNDRSIAAILAPGTGKGFVGFVNHYIQSLKAGQARLFGASNALMLDVTVFPKVIISKMAICYRERLRIRQARNMLGQYLYCLYLLPMNDTQPRHRAIATTRP